MTTLIEIKNFIKEKKSTNIFSIANTFKEDPDYILHMLEHFLNKGTIKCKEQKLCSSSCNKNCIKKYSLEVVWIEN